MLKKEDYNLDEAIKKAVCKRQYAFDKLIKESLEDEEEEEDSEEEESGDEDTSS